MKSRNHKLCTVTGGFGGSGGLISDMGNFSATKSKEAKLQFFVTLQFRLTTSPCALSRCWLIMYMQIRLVHHLISTKLHCASPRCTSVQNYMVHNAGRCCTMQVDGTHHSSVPLKWCTTRFHKPTQTTDRCYQMYYLPATRSIIIENIYEGGMYGNA